MESKSSKVVIFSKNDGNFFRFFWTDKVVNGGERGKTLVSCGNFWGPISLSSSSGGNISYLIGPFLVFSFSFLTGRKKLSENLLIPSLSARRRIRRLVVVFTTRISMMPSPATKRDYRSNTPGLYSSANYLKV